MTTWGRFGPDAIAWPGWVVYLTLCRQDFIEAHRVRRFDRSRPGRMVLYNAKHAGFYKQISIWVVVPKPTTWLDSAAAGDTSNYANV
ncbi:MAG: hypothetical protein CMQ11_09150 [Gammaproteobacteria bacterium]|nr:hypothetical protein [Gammaproteobacteria bacterium]